MQPLTLEDLATKLYKRVVNAGVSRDIDEPAHFRFHRPPFRTNLRLDDVPLAQFLPIHLEIEDPLLILIEYVETFIRGKINPHSPSKWLIARFGLKDSRDHQYLFATPEDMATTGTATALAHLVLVMQLLAWNFPEMKLVAESAAVRLDFSPTHSFSVTNRSIFLATGERVPVPFHRHFNLEQVLWRYRKESITSPDERLSALYRHVLVGSVDGVDIDSIRLIFSLLVYGKKIGALLPYFEFYLPDTPGIDWDFLAGFRQQEYPLMFLRENLVPRVMPITVFISMFGQPYKSIGRNPLNSSKRKWAAALQRTQALYEEKQQPLTEPI